MDEKKELDIIQASNVKDFPTESTGAKEKVVTFLSGLQEQDTRSWASIKTIAQESKVSPVYTRHVLDKLTEDQVIEKGNMGKKQYFRLVQKK